MIQQGVRLASKRLQVLRQARSNKKTKRYVLILAIFVQQRKWHIMGTRNITVLGASASGLGTLQS